MEISKKKAFLAKTVLTFGDVRNDSLIASALNESFRQLPECQDMNTLQNKSLKLYKSLISSFSTRYLKKKFKKMYIYREDALKSMARRKLINDILRLANSKLYNYLLSDVRIKKNFIRRYF